MAPFQNGNTGNTNGPKIVFDLKTVAITVFAVLIIVSLAFNSDSFSYLLLMLGVTVGFVFVFVRMLGSQILSQSHPMINPSRGATKCPQCGSTMYSVSVKRRQHSGIRDSKNMKRKAANELGSMLSRQTFGLSDTVLSAFGNRNANVRHDAMATCRRCGFTWTIRKGGL